MRLACSRSSQTGIRCPPGLVSSLARPGGRVTGLTNINAEMGAKLVELLHDAAAGVRRFGCLIDPALPNVENGINLVRQAAARFRMEVRLAQASNPAEIGPALTRLQKDDVGVLIPLPSAWFTGERQQVVTHGLAQRWPIVASQSEWAEAGALAAYGADRVELYRRAAYFVDRVLRGTRPGDLPIEQPTTFETVVNLRTARLLGLTMPQAVLVRANRVIE